MVIMGATSSSPNRVRKWLTRDITLSTSSGTHELSPIPFLLPRHRSPCAFVIPAAGPQHLGDTRYAQGTPGQLVVLARRKGKVWYVAGIAGDSQARNLTVPLTFLDSGSYTATQIADGSTDRTFSDVTTRAVTAADSLTPSLRGNGGFVARLVPAQN
jgi:hypothetical protein